MGYGIAALLCLPVVFPVFWWLAVTMGSRFR